jgi:transmembrane sensor
MSTKDAQVRDLVTRQAADWLVANRAELSAREREAFVAWLKASSAHVEEYLAVAAIARDLRDACAELAASTDSLVALAREAGEEPTPIGSASIAVPRDTRPGPRRAAALAWGALGVICLSLFGWWNFRVKPPQPATVEAATAFHFSSRHGEQQTHRLPDDSVLHLNTDTAVSVRLSAAERLVTLESGEADFEVAHEPKRPFRVLAGSAQMLDVGTQFDVRLEPGVTVITVVDGRVAVGPRSPAARANSSGNSSANSSAAFVELTANEQLHVAEWPPSAPVAADAHGTTSWMRRQITFEHEPLSSVAREFNRYAPKPIVITTPALGKQEISGVFTIDDTDEFIAFLRSLKGVHVEVTDSRVLVSQDPGTAVHSKDNQK